jgi:hypothetical protein
MKKLIEWMIKTWLPFHHLSRNPAKRTKRTKNTNKEVNNEDIKLSS